MPGRIRAALVTIASTPWRRAPLAAWRRPGVAAAVAGAGAVMAASVAAVPLFVSSAGVGSVAVQVEERCPSDTGATLRTAASAEAVRQSAPDPFAPVGGQLGPTTRWSVLEGLTLTGPDPERSTDATLLAREGALDAVDVVEGTAGPGLWITDRAAASTGLGAGDTATLAGVDIPVAGVYRDLAGSAIDERWCSHRDLLLLEVVGGDMVLPPPVALVDPGTFADVVVGAGIPEAVAAWEAPLRGDVTIAEVDALVSRLACSGGGSAVLGWCADGQPAVATFTGRDRVTERVMARDDADFVERFLDSSLPFVAARGRAVQASIGGGIWPMSGLAALAGVGLVAAAASLWFDRRRRDLTLLIARGVSPAGLGLKAVLELSIPLLLGAALGVAAAWAMVVLVGPAPIVEPRAVGVAALAGAVALGGAMLATALVVARRARRAEVPARRRLPLGALPWELLLVWATVTSYHRLGDFGVPVGRGADLTRVDVLGLLFPVLFLVTAVAVLGRLLALGVRPLRAVTRSAPAAVHLGVRRLARHRTAVIGLAAASAVAAGVLGYAITVNRSLDATLDVKASGFVGSDLAARVPDDTVVPPELEGRSTTVTVHNRAWLDPLERRSVEVLGIDPATFADAARWDGDFADRSLEDVLASIRAPAEDGVVPAVVVGDRIGGTEIVGVVQGATTRVAIAPVEGVDAFPGMSKPEITVVVSQSTLRQLGVDGGRTELWVRGDHDASADVLRSHGIGFEEVRSVADVADRAAFVTVSWTFGFMQSLGFAAGLLALGGAAVYLDARRRDRALGYAFMRRMGLSRGSHRRALAIELAGSVLVGCWVGLAIALAAAGLAHDRIDPVPGYRPDPVLRPALDVIIAFGVATLVLVVVGAVLAQQRVDRDDPVEVLRAGS